MHAVDSTKNVPAIVGQATLTQCDYDHQHLRAYVSATESTDMQWRQ